DKCSLITERRTRKITRSPFVGGEQNGYLAMGFAGARLAVGLPVAGRLVPDAALFRCDEGHHFEIFGWFCWRRACARTLRQRRHRADRRRPQSRRAPLPPDERTDRLCKVHPPRRL